MTEFYRNGPGKTIVDVQAGAGNTWQVLDPNAEAGAFSGGKQSVESVWGRDAHGRNAYLGTSKTGNPARITQDISQRVDVQEALSNVLMKLNEVGACNCADDGLNLRVRYRCNDIEDLNGYEFMMTLLDAHSTNQSSSDPMANASDGTDKPQMFVDSMSAGVATYQRRLSLQDVKGTVNDYAFNDIVWRCNGEYYAVTDADDSPGYQSVATPMLFYTLNSGTSWSSVYIEPFISGDAKSIVIRGNRIIVSSDTNGVAYCDIDRLKDGVTNPNLWTVSTGFTGNYPNRLFVAPGGVVWAVGDTGRIYKSTDGGGSFSTESAGTVTTENLEAVQFESSSLGWFAGANGALVRYYQGTLSLITSGLAVTINDVAVPPGRSDEVYLATAGGEIYRSDNALLTTPTFTSKSFDRTGNGQIDRLYFYGYKGQYLFFIQSDADSDSRIMRDNSGGALGMNVEAVGDFEKPENNGFNALALGNQNTGFAVGEVIDSQAFIGELTT